jgi:hypothetical protein
LINTKKATVTCLRGIASYMQLSSEIAFWS